MDGGESGGSVRYERILIFLGGAAAGGQAHQVAVDVDPELGPARRPQLVLLMESGFARKVRDESWQNYQHELGSAGGTELGINIDSDLMRLATGGSAS